MQAQPSRSFTIEGFGSLTEKEKETLRLLLAGHDAKSMARHLGLSIHTVNERLRDARRKLSVSSSKEAARLLRQSEAQDPEKLGDEPFGDAASDAIDHPSDQPATAPRLKRPALWAIGGFAMIAFITALLALASPNTTPPAANAPTAQAASNFLSLLDASNWPATYAATGKQFQSVNSLQLWQSSSEQARVPLGRMLSRTLTSDEWVPAPPNGYRVVRFRTDFANRKGVLETVSLEKEGDAWKVVAIMLD